MKISKVIVAMDSFKGSMTTYEAGNAVACGIVRVFPNAEAIVCPIADGGEGSVDAIISTNNGRKRKIAVKNPIGKYIEAEYGILQDEKTAVIEMAAAAGITLISNEEKQPMHTTTFGVGEMIRDAITQGCRKFIIGIGGSATNDGGVGMLSALGFQFLDESGKCVPYGAMGLSLINEIRCENAMPELYESEFIIACDVQNPLCGENGCSFVYGPQKGADYDTVLIMDNAMKNYEFQTRKINNSADGNIPGSGAAGGVGFAFLSYLNGKLKSGIDIIIEQTGLENKVKASDLVVTGEGRLDGQSCMGKAPTGIAAIAKKYGKPVIAFSGCVTDDATRCNDFGIDAFFPILRAPCTMEEAMKNGEKNLADTVEQTFRLINIL